MVGERELAGVDLLMLTNASFQQNKTSSIKLQRRRQFVWAPPLVRPENYRSGNSLCFSELSRVWFIQERENNLFQAASDEAESNGQEDDNADGKSGAQDAEPTSAGVSHASFQVKLGDL